MILIRQFGSFFCDLDALNFDVTYFRTNYYDALEGWAGNTAYAQWGNTTNSTSTTKAEGIEFMSKWKTNDSLNFDFNYTYTSTYDGAEFENPDLNTADYVNSQMVRVPRHFFNLITNYQIPETNLGLTLRTKISSKARDYGNANNPSKAVLRKNIFNKVFIFVPLFELIIGIPVFTSENVNENFNRIAASNVSQHILFL